MSNDNVVFKGIKDGIAIYLDEREPFDSLKNTFRKKAAESRRFFGNQTVSVSFQGKHITDIEKDELLNILTSETSLTVLEGSVPKQLNSGRLEPEPEAIPSGVTGILNAIDSAGPALFHKGSLRSGKALSYGGSIIVIGDVNPGGEIVAEGNVIVLGSVKGMVHAGCSGNTECFIAALNLSSMQLRIADIITYIPPELSRKAKGEASLAYIENGQIYIAPL